MKKFSLLVSSLATVTMITGAILMSTTTSADSRVDEISVTIETACTMTGTGMNSHTATISPGTYEDDIGITTLKAFCNDANGFAIYAAGYTGDEIGGTNSTKLVNSAASTNNTINTGTDTTGTISNWAMKLNTNSSDTYPITLDNSFGSYHVVPNTYTKVAHRDSATDVGNNATGSTLTTTYAAAVASTQAPGTYAGKVIYTLVHPSSEIPLQPQTATSGCINYFPNGSNVVGTMGCQSISSSDTTAMLLASNFSRTGYGFAGWSDSYDYASNSNANFYGPNETITFTAGQYTGDNEGLGLYAVWVKSEGSLQDANKVTALCGTNGTGGSLTAAPTDGTANLASVSALTDQRDNETYAIAKLADGYCWMIENLRLENTNSDNSTGALAQGYGTSATYGNFSGLADPETPDKFSAVNSANTLYSNNGNNGTIIVDNSYRMPRYNNVNTPTNESDRPQNPTTNSDTNNTTNAGMYSYGNYYSWHAAIANLNPNDTDNQSTTGTSLCPAGWHLPIGGSSANANSSEFWRLGLGIMGAAPSSSSYYQTSQTNAAGDNALIAFRKYPNNFVYAGGIYSDSVSDRGTLSYYWSSTANSSTRVYSLALLSSSVGPGTINYSKFTGRPIRCVAGV